MLRAREGRGVVAAGEDALAVAARAEAGVKVDPGRAPAAARRGGCSTWRSVAWLQVGSLPP
jgi:hypothetical protein